MKILLVRNDNFGDLLCTTPAIEALRKAYPFAQIDIVVNSYNFLAIRKNPFVNCVYVYTKPKHEKTILAKVKAFSGKLALFGKIFRIGYDIAVVFRSSYSPYAEQFSVVSRAKTRIGVKNPKGEDYFTYHVIPKEGEHEVEFCYRCLEPLKVFYGGEKLWFYLEDEYVEKYASYGIELLFHLSSRRKENRLSTNNLLKLCKKIKNAGIKLSLTAAPGDREIARALENELKVSFIETPTILDLAGAIKNAKLFLTLDGGTVHLGPALGVKTIAVFGSTPLERWYPWGYKELTIKSKTGNVNDIDLEEILQKVEANI